VTGPNIDPKLAEQLIQRCAAGVLGDLKHLYPLASEHQLQQIAVGVAQDQVGQMMPMFNALSDSRFSRVGIVLQRPSKLAGGKTAELSFASPRDLEACASLDEVLSTATVYALVYCPTVRAILAKHGYHVRFLADGPAQTGQKVLSLDQARKRKVDAAEPASGGDGDAG